MKAVLYYGRRVCMVKQSSFIFRTGVQSPELKSGERWVATGLAGETLLSYGNSN